MIAQLAGDLAQELSMAHTIIFEMLNLLATPQKAVLSDKLADVIGVSGGTTRYHERRAVLVRAGYLTTSAGTMVQSVDVEPAIGNWCVSLISLRAWYERDHDESSEPLFTTQKERAQRFTLAEAETMVAGLRATNDSRYSDAVMVSAGGQS